MDISKIVQAQRSYFFSSVTRSLKFRLDALHKLKAAVISHEGKINEALIRDLNKQPMETYMTETGIVLDEIDFHIRHLNKWAKQKRRPTPLSQFCAKSYVSPEPYGIALILSPWNYPVQLCLEPLVGAISAGNCTVIKPSAHAPAASAAVGELIAEVFPPEYITVVQGGREQNMALLSEKFDYIFFTGSVAVGKVVMEAAAKNLTPLTLELGGKSPVIVDETVNLEIAAKRIAFGKVLNAGQTCVAPDYLFIHESVKDSFIEEYKKALHDFFPDGNMKNMPVIINEKHFKRISGLMNGETAIIGGGSDETKRFIEPTVLDNINGDSPIMGEEIFGPVLPIMTYTDIDNVIPFIRARPKPLALYLFTSNKETEKKIIENCSFGGGCINDTVIHTANHHMGFGGVGNSGMGSYHGKLSFDTFTHYRSIIDKATWTDPPMRYHPYKPQKLNIIKKLIK